MSFKEFLKERAQVQLESATVDEIKNTIISAAKKERISIRNIEVESKTLIVYFNYDDEAPSGFLSDKSEVREELTWLVKGVLQDLELNHGKEVFTKDVQNNVGTMNIQIKDKAL